jgi:hypothetical protein
MNIYRMKYSELQMCLVEVSSKLRDQRKPLEKPSYFPNLAEKYSLSKVVANKQSILFMFPHDVVFSPTKINDIQNYAVQIGWQTERVNDVYDGKYAPQFDMVYWDTISTSRLNPDGTSFFIMSKAHTPDVTYLLIEGKNKERILKGLDERCFHPSNIWFTINPQDYTRYEELVRSEEINQLIKKHIALFEDQESPVEHRMRVLHDKRQFGYLEDFWKKLFDEGVIE